MEETKQQDFKLLAIQPREGCHPEIRKVLKEGEIYTFYPSYQFERNSKREVIQITAPKDEPRLYDLDGLLINISAVVGKNGSGKSTLTEMLYYFNYCLGISLKNEGSLDERILPLNSEALLKELQEHKKGISDSREKLQIIKEQIDHLSGEGNSLTTAKRLYILRKEKLKLREKIYESKQRLSEISEQVPLEEKAHNHIREHFKVSIFYQLKGMFYEVRYNRKLYMYSISGRARVSIPTLRAREIFDNFFYTISINYSHYALNSNYIGSWIKTLFHKNDAYQAPIVINPMRVEGNFDINDENSFSIYRLLHNLLLEKLESPNDKIKLTDNQYVEKIRFQLNPSKTGDVNIRIKDRDLSGKKEAVYLFLDLQEIFFDDTYLNEVVLMEGDLPFQNEIYNYIIRKLEKISRTYSIYDRKAYRFRVSSQRGNRSFLNKLKKDNSHITFKLKQAINFLRAGMSSGTSPWSNPTRIHHGLPYFDFTLEELLSWMNFDSKNPEELINFLPPSIFTIDIYLSSSNEDAMSTEELSRFSALSSGEQQMIHSVQSVLYHLNNLQSAHSSNDSRQTYKSINIIYDEIELYFHPEYQRQFIHAFLESINRLKFGDRDGIRCINILFSTHSPFVLSDIPGTNILRLDSGKQKPLVNENKTFGANIYTLLKDSFFLESYIGEHAKEEIQKLIILLQIEPKEKTTEKTKEVYDEMRLKLKSRIELIGEPFLQGKLLEMFYDKFGIEERISGLEKELEELKRKSL